MSLSLALNSALSGLNVSQQALTVLSQNISNANTPGYSRKVVEQSTNVVAGTGAGAKIEEISRKIDQYLNTAIQRQNGQVGKADILNEFAERVQLLLGQPGDVKSLNNLLSGFSASLQGLAENPERGAQRLDAVNTGSSLARDISNLATEINALRYQADLEIKAAVSEVNLLLRKLNDVNQAISFAHNAGQPTAELADQRDKYVREISEFLDLSVYETETQQIYLSTNTGVPLEDSAAYQLFYTAQPSTDALISGSAFNALTSRRLDDAGNVTNDSVVLVTAGPSDQVVTGMVTGKIRGLLDMRDEHLPRVLEMLDTLAAVLRDEMNALHNAGSSFPGTSSLTGTREVNASEFYQWEGEVRIALLDSTGRPILSPYSGEESGLRPLTIDLSTLDTGQGAGQPSIQGLINELNYNFNQPQSKVQLGDINNIRLVSAVDVIPDNPPQLTFDFDLENISGGDANFFVTGITVLDDTNADITSVTNTVPTVALDATNTYTTTAGSGNVTITAAAAHGFQEGDLIYLSDPGVAVDGIPAADLEGFFRITNVTSNTFQISVSSTAVAGATTGVANVSALPRYTEATTGDTVFTRPNGSYTQSLVGNDTSEFYLVTATVGVENADGSVSVGTIRYKVLNNATNNYNRRYGGESVTGDAVLTASSLNSPLLTASLVDANGKELPKTNGAYTLGDSGYLKITSNNSNYFLAIDSLDSKQLGFPNDTPPKAGTNRGFSHFFELNNFFESNNPTSTGDTIAGSAVNMAVVQRLLTNPDQISLGRLTQSRPPTDPNKPPLYTYERSPGDNSIIQQMAGLSENSLFFQAAGGLGQLTTTLNGYSSEILGFMATQAQNFNQEFTSSQIIIKGFEERLTSVSGVNIDEELANTIIYQNAYSASARIITITNSLFDTLLQAFS